MTRRVSRLLLAVLLGSCFSALAQTAAAQQYQVSYLGALGGTVSRGNSINNRGWVAGYSNLPGNQSRHAALWQNGSLLDLGTLGGPNSSVTWPVKNNSGLIAGIAQTAAPDPLGERWSCSAFFPGPNKAGYICLGFAWDGGALRALPTLGGNNGFATGANNRRQVVGWAENTVHDPTCVPPQVLQFRPVIWAPGTDQIQELPLIAGDTSGAATAINNSGQVVGISGICDQAVGRYTAKHAVLWDKGAVIDIGNLGAEIWVTPMSINQRGDVVGFAATQPGDVDGDFLRAFLWTRKSGISNLGTLPGHVFSQANAVNERGQVVGISCPEDFDCRAFLWENGVMRNLNDLIAPGFGGVLISAQDVNDQGEVTGRAFDPTTGQLRAYVAVPIGSVAGKQAGTSAAQAKVAKVVVPEDVRQTLRRQRGIGNAALLR